MTDKPLFLGKHLLVHLAQPSNGTREAFGVVTRVWSPECVNITVFPDNAPPFTSSSMPVRSSREHGIEQAQALAKIWADQNHDFPKAEDGLPMVTFAYHPPVG